MSLQKYVAVVILVLLCSFVQAQSFQFAFVSDTHIGNATAQEDLERTIADINANPDLEFVVITGDITEFGVVFVPLHTAMVSALSRQSGEVLWKYKNLNSLMNPVMPLGKTRAVVSTMDGKIACLEYLPDEAQQQV